MPCYECGSAEGTVLQLCPACIERKREEKLQVRHDFLHNQPKEELVHSLMNDPWVRAGGILQLLSISFIVLLFTGPVAQHGLWAAFLFAGMCSTAFIAALLAIFFWIRMLFTDTIGALISILLPCFVYRYVVLNWEQKEVKVYFFLQIGCTALTFFLAQLLANHLAVSLWRVLTVFNLYKYGIAADLKEPLFPGFDGAGF